jgi:DNA polymerase-3 subunit delta
MKIAPARIRPFLAAPDKSVCAILVYGPDTGLVDERADALARSVVADLGDPFRVARLTGAALAADPARLADEAAAIPFGGGRRVVIVSDAEDAAAPAARGFLAAPLGDAMVILRAGELGPKSKLRLLFEEADNAAALPCYLDDGEALAGVIREALGKHGLAADPDTMEWLADHLGGDRRATRSELEKLAIFMGRPGRLKLEDAIACIGDGAAITLDDLALATGDGDHEQAQRALDKVLAEGTHPVALLRTLARHFKRLHLLAGMTAAGRSPDEAIGSLKPKPFFRTAARLRGQLARWPVSRAGSALELLQQAEIDVKTTGMPAEAICGRAVLQLARAAGRAK